MTLVLTLVGLSLVLTFVSAVVLAAALRAEPAAAHAVPDIEQVAGRPAFFGHPAPRRPGTVASTVPVEVLLLELERHIRLEQAAAESFHRAPTSAALHMATSSPLVH